MPGFALELPDEITTTESTDASTPNEDVDKLAREIQKNKQWRVLDWKPKLLEKKTVYQFKLLNRKRGRVQVIEVDPGHPELDHLE